MTDIRQNAAIGRFPAFVRSLLADRQGTTAVVMGVGMTAFVGVAGIATETGLWYAKERAMQGAADGAAVSAAVDFAAGDTGGFAAQAIAAAAANGFTNGVNNVTVAVNQPPKSGQFASNPNAIQVTISQPQRQLFSKLFMANAPVLSVNAVAVPGTGIGSGSGSGGGSGGGGQGCVLSLDKSKTAIGLNAVGTTNINLNNCSLYVNSEDTDALNMTGTAYLAAYSAYISGNYQLSGGAQLNTAHGTITGAAPTPDPYVNVQIPSYLGCNQNNFSLNAGKTQSITAQAGGAPYVFCNGIQLTGGSTLNLPAGVVIIDRGTLSVSGNSTLNATAGTTIILTSSTGSGYATIDFKGGATINVTAPSSGTTKGLAFFQDRNAPTSGTDSFAGGATQNITGAVYIPSQNVSYAGGTQTGSSTQCTQLVAFTITFVGNAGFALSNCPTGLASIGGAPTALVQ